MSTYLLEVGTEELPYKFIPQAISQLETGFKNFFDENKINFDNIKVYETPRRLAVLVYGLDEKTADEEKIVKGHIANIDYEGKYALLKTKMILKEQHGKMILFDVKESIKNSLIGYRMHVQ